MEGNDYEQEKYIRGQVEKYKQAEKKFPAGSDAILPSELPDASTVPEKKTERAELTEEEQAFYNMNQGGVPLSIPEMRFPEGWQPDPSSSRTMRLIYALVKKGYIEVIEPTTHRFTKYVFIQ